VVSYNLRDYENLNIIDIIFVILWSLTGSFLPVLFIPRVTIGRDVLKALKRTLNE